MQKGEQSSQVSSLVQPIQEGNLRLGFSTCTSHKWLVKFPYFTKNCDFSYSHHLYYIYLIIHRNGRGAYWEKNPKKGFYNTPTFLERNICNLFSFPLLLLYPLKGDLYPNTTHTHSKCWECFWSLGRALEDAKDGKCNMELIEGSGKLEKIRFDVTLLEQVAWRT